MERRNAQVFEAEEATDLEDSGAVDVSAPTVVVSAAPLPACVRSSALTVRHVPIARPPGKALGTQPPPRRVRPPRWMGEPVETAPIGAIPMPGERARSQAVTIVQRARTDEPQRPLATRAAEPPVQYSVERALAGPQRASSPRRTERDRNILVAIIGLLAGLVIVLSAVVVRQQRELGASDVPAQRARQACGAYAAEVRAVMQELTQAAGAVADVEVRIGERARSVIEERGMQLLCTGEAHRCARGDAGCVADAVMKLRQALSR